MLNERQRRLYARQVIVRELGQAGQARLCASLVVVTPPSDPAAAGVAMEYLHRAGMQLCCTSYSPQTDAVQVATATSAQVRSIAAEPALQACAEWLLGAWAAVEAIKRCTDVGTQARAVPDPLCAEPD